MKKIKQIILRIKNLSKERFINWQKARKGNRLYALVDAMAIVSQCMESAIKTPPPYAVGGVVEINQAKELAKISPISLESAIRIIQQEKLTIQPDPCPKNNNKVAE